MRKLSPRETLILIITLGLAVFFIAYQLVVKPMREGSTDINDQLRLGRNQLINDSLLVAQSPSIESRYKNLVDLIGVADSEEAQMPIIVAKIEAVARESNVHIANIQPRKTVTQKEAMFLPVELEIDAQWVNIVQFLHLLQQQPNFYFINELNLEKYSGVLNSLRGRIVISRMFLVSP
jgi:Tfp pilus assembly protein PilO